MPIFSPGRAAPARRPIARLLAKAANCLAEDLAERPCNACQRCLAVNEGRYMDLIEIDAASNTGVDDIRDLRDKINFSPSDGRYKVYIIDEVHMLSTAAFNALLKTLEEPPAHAMFILATTEEHKVPLTIKSRCQQFNFRLLTTQEIVGRLQWLADQEDLSLEPEAMTMIAQHGTGSLRDAESLLDQLVMEPGDTITLERAQTVLGTASRRSDNRPDRSLAERRWTGRAEYHSPGPGIWCRSAPVRPPDGGLLAPATAPANGRQRSGDGGHGRAAGRDESPGPKGERQALIEAVKGFNEAATVNG